MPPASVVMLAARPCRLPRHRGSPEYSRLRMELPRWPPACAFMMLPACASGVSGIRHEVLLVAGP